MPITNLNYVLKWNETSHRSISASNQNMTPVSSGNEPLQHINRRFISIIIIKHNQPFLLNTRHPLKDRLNWVIQTRYLCSRKAGYASKRHGNTVHRGSINPKHMWQPVRYFFYKSETDLSLSNPSCSPEETGAPHNQFTISTMNKNLLKFVQYIFPSYKQWAGVWFLKYRDLHMPFPCIGGGNTNIVLADKIYTNINCL